MKKQKLAISIVTLQPNEKTRLSSMLQTSRVSTSRRCDARFFEEVGIYPVNPCKKLFNTRKQRPKTRFFYFSGKQGENIAQHFI